MWWEPSHRQFLQPVAEPFSFLSFSAYGRCVQHFLFFIPSFVSIYFVETGVCFSFGGLGRARKVILFSPICLGTPQIFRRK